MVGAGVFALSARLARSPAPRSGSLSSPLVPWRAFAAIAAIAGLPIVLDAVRTGADMLPPRRRRLRRADDERANARAHFKPDVPSDSAVEFLLAFARVGHDAGYPTADLEGRVSSLADAVGLEAAQVSATPTTVVISLGSLPRQRSYAIRARSPIVDLDAIARLDALVRDVLDERLTAEAALEQVGDVNSRPLCRPWFVQIAAYALAGASVTPVLGGGWHEVLARRHGRGARRWSRLVCGTRGESRAGGCSASRRRSQLQRARPREARPEGGPWRSSRSRL
jgi:hypothetical protein